MRRMEERNKESKINEEYDSNELYSRILVLLQVELAFMKARMEQDESTDFYEITDLH
jgi:hypothetical protein